jgi:hypothetical protein
VRRVIDVTEQAPPEHAGAASVGIDDDSAQCREVDHDSVVDAPRPRSVVAAATDGDLQAGLTREGH